MPGINEDDTGIYEWQPGGPELVDAIFDIRSTGDVAPSPGAHLSAEQRVIRSKLVGILDYHQAGGLGDHFADDGIEIHGLFAG